MEEENFTPSEEGTSTESSTEETVTQTFNYDTARPPVNEFTPGTNPASPLAAG